ncbi:zinc finger and BTB domain-containing protein 5-like [Stigmatopora argus]
MDFPAHFQDIFQQLNLQRLHAQLCDCVVEVGGREFHAHRSILAACSSHFKALLGSDDVADGAARAGKVGRPDALVLDPEVVTPEAFSTLLDMIYTSSLSLGTSNAMDVLLAASHLHLNSVVKACKVHLSRKNFPATAPEGWRSAQKPPSQTASAELLREYGVEASQLGYDSSQREEETGAALSPTHVTATIWEEKYDARTTESEETRLETLVKDEEEPKPETVTIKKETATSPERSPWSSPEDEVNAEKPSCSDGEVGIHPAPLATFPSQIEDGDVREDQSTDAINPREEENPEMVPTCQDFMGASSARGSDSALVFPVSSLPSRQLVPAQIPDLSDTLLFQPTPSCLAVFGGLQTTKSPNGTAFRRIAPKSTPGSEEAPARSEAAPLTRAPKHVLSKCKKAAAAVNVLLVEGDKKYACEICKKRFANLTDCKKHIRVHTGEKPYSCLKCGKCFSQSSHMYTHAKNYTCLNWKRIPPKTLN